MARKSRAKMETIDVATTKQDTLIKVKAKVGAKLPKKATDDSAAMDICAHTTLPVWIRPGEFKMIPTGLFTIIPQGYCLEVYPRSGLAAKKGITVINTPGLIDSDFRQEIHVLLINHGSEQFEVKNGDRIAQFRLKKVEDWKWEELSEQQFNEILENEQNSRTGGFGSTGV